MSIGNRPPSVRDDGRRPTDLRPVTMTLGVLKWAEGSCRIRAGDTEVLCAATVGDRVPPHLRGKGSGWVTAEYSMLPRATAERSDRESVKGRIGGRTHEIQRLIGRSLRGVVDLGKLGEKTITVDCDVLQADGGTRCASITGGYVALAMALMGAGLERTLVGKVAAISVGVPSAKTAPLTSTVMRSAKRNTRSMSCSMMRTAMSLGSVAMASSRMWLSALGMPAAGSSSNSTRGCRPSAIAISTRR